MLLKAACLTLSKPWSEMKLSFCCANCSANVKLNYYFSNEKQHQQHLESFKKCKFSGSNSEPEVLPGVKTSKHVFQVSV